MSTTFLRSSTYGAMKSCSYIVAEPIAAHVERPADAMSAPVVANRLRDRQDVRFVERPRERRAPVSARAEADLLRGLSWVRLADVIFLYELLRIDQQLFRCRLAGERGKCHGNAPLGDRAGPGVPDLGRIFGDGAVAGEPARCGHVQDCLMCPSVPVAVESNQSPVGLEIGAQGCEVHVVVAA